MKDWIVAYLVPTRLYRLYRRIRYGKYPEGYYECCEDHRE